MQHPDQHRDPLDPTNVNPGMLEHTETGFKKLADTAWGPYEACIFRTSITGKKQLYSIDTDVLYEIAKKSEITARALRDVDPVTALAIKKAKDALYPAKKDMNRTPKWKLTTDGVQRELSGGLTETVSRDGKFLIAKFNNAGVVTEAKINPEHVNLYARSMIADAAALAQKPRPTSAF